MSTIHNPTRAAFAAETQNITLSAQPIDATEGSLKWLLKQQITAKFYEPMVPYEADFPHRIAILSVGEFDLTVAADGAFYDERNNWVARDSFHSIPISWDQFGCPTLGVSLTPSAREHLEQVAEEIRLEFVDWLYSDLFEEKLSIRVIHS